MCNDHHHDHQCKHDTKLANIIIASAIMAALLIGIAIVQREQAASKLRREAQTKQVNH